MFAKTIIDSDAFLDMPLSAQSLYFHLAMRADDDGFINNPRKIQRMVGAAGDDLKLLIAKNFIIPFESGVVVIKHWKIHNYIQKDRYKETVYLEEKSRLGMKENKAYTRCSQNGYSLEAQISSEQSRTEEYSVNPPKASPVDYALEFEALWQDYPNKKGKQDALRHFIKARKAGVTVEAMAAGIAAYRGDIARNKTESRYIKHGSTFFQERAWEDAYDPGAPQVKSEDRDETDVFLGQYGGGEDA